MKGVVVRLRPRCARPLHERGVGARVTRSARRRASGPPLATAPGTEGVPLPAGAEPPARPQRARALPVVGRRQQSAVPMAAQRVAALPGDARAAVPLPTVHLHPHPPAV